MLRFAVVAGICLVVVYLALRRSLGPHPMRTEVEPQHTEHDPQRIPRNHAGPPGLHAVYRRLSRAARPVLAVLASTLIPLLVFGASTANAGRYFGPFPVAIENPSVKVVLIAFALTLGIDLALIVFLAFLPRRRRAGSQVESPRTEHRQSERAKSPGRWRQPEPGEPGPAGKKGASETPAGPARLPAPIGAGGASGGATAV